MPPPPPTPPSPASWPRPARPAKRRAEEALTTFDEPPDVMRCPLLRVSGGEEERGAALGPFPTFPLRTSRGVCRMYEIQPVPPPRFRRPLPFRPPRGPRRLLDERYTRADLMLLPRRGPARQAALRDASETPTAGPPAPTGPWGGAMSRMQAVATA